MINTGPALQVGDSFQLFNQAVAGFTTVNLPLTDVNNNRVYTWTNRVAINGSIQVLTAVPPVNTTPTNITVHVSGGNLALSWPLDHTGWTLQVQTNTLNIGLSTNWVDVAGSSTTNQMTLPVNSGNGCVFFRLVY